MVVHSVQIDQVMENFDSGHTFSMVYANHTTCDRGLLLAQLSENSYDSKVTIYIKEYYIFTICDTETASFDHAISEL